MPEGRNEAAVSGEDRISPLPEAILLHTLSLLPADEVVRTSVLARRWRNLWKYTPSLRLIHERKPRFRSAEHFNKLVTHLIALRGCSRLVNCEIELYPPSYGTYAHPYAQAAQLWIHYALACQVQVLNVIDDCGDHQLNVHVPFISMHLKTLHLQGVVLECSMDFSSCPVLEDLKLTCCFICAQKVSSKSLKRLCLTQCQFRDEVDGVRTRISVPGLLSLLLEDCVYRTPLLESMPLLETAFIRLERCEDVCDYGYGICDKTDCHGCYGFDGRQSVLLNGLSNAINLELIGEPETYIFRRDVASCPIFGRLKTLLLNEWCATFDMYSLVRVLRRTPILEKLTLQICNNRNIVSPIGAEGKNVPAEQSFVCAQLKVANIECRELDEKVRKICNILRTCGVHPEKICIKTQRSGLSGFSYDRL